MSTTSSPHVLIIGGGIGGLCLAQGLKKAGIRATVFERDPSPASRLQGYRIHINPEGSRALQACLPPRLFDVFLVTSGKGDSYSFFTEKMEELLSVGDTSEAPDPIDSHKSVSRITLRQVLLAGLGDRVRFGKKFTHYEVADDGRVTAFFEDGSSAAGDLLVAADGVHSRVRRQFLPHADVIDTGVRAVMGKLPLTEETRSLLPPRLFDGPASILAPKGHCMFLAVNEFGDGPEGLPGFAGEDGNPVALPPGLLHGNTADFAMWGFSARREKFGLPAELKDLNGTILRRVVLEMIADWHPNLKRLVHFTDPSAITPVTIRSSVPIAHWGTKNITLIGDAIHSMTPFRGIGANTALKDAALLCRNLVAAQRGEKSLLQAVHDYEVEMIRYGFEAVKNSLRAMNQAVSDNAFALATVKTLFRLVNAIPPLKRRMFKDQGNK